MTAAQQFSVGAAAVGERLDHFLAGPLGSRARAQRLIDAGLVLVDGEQRPKRHRLSADETVTVRQSESAHGAGAVAADVAFGVAFEDSHLMIVDKPAGLVVHPGRGHRDATLSQALAGRAAGGTDPIRAGIVHRLDRDTSGLLVVAKSELVHRRLQAQLAARRIAREYLALVEGRPPARRGTIDAPIGRDRHARTKVSTDTDVPRAARTDFELERCFADTTLLRIRLQTGRTHQIRVHLGAIGHPVCGDPVYGTPGRFGLTRQFLHAARLRLEHPLTGEALDVSSPLPEDLARALARAH